MSEKPRRFRFGLRTLFVLMTLFGLCLWQAIQWNWIQERNSMLHQFITRSDRFEECNPGDAPWSIRLLGAHGISSFRVSNEFLPHERNRLQVLFPEARLSEGVPVEHQGRGIRFVETGN